MTPKVTLIIFLSITVVAALIEGFADALLEKWSLVGKGHILIGGLAVYFVSSIFWAYSLKFETLSKGIVLFNVVNVIIGVTIGVLYFKEVLTGVNAIGIALGLVSVVLLSL